MQIWPDGQSEFETQSTHFFVAGSQTGVSPGHCALVVHSVVQLPVVVSQTSGGVQFALEVHSTHFFVAGSQIGVSPGHCALVVHGPQLPVVVSQTSGVTQFALLMHSTQVFVVGLQMGLSPGHCTLSVQDDPHWPVVGLQIGSFAGQSVFAEHSTHVFVPG